MHRRSLFWMFIGFLGIWSAIGNAEVWKASFFPVTSDPILSLYQTASSGSKILGASQRQLFERTENSARWAPLAAIPAPSPLRVIADRSVDDHSIYFLSDREVLRWRPATHRWSSVYQSRVSSVDKPLAFAVLPGDPDHWFLGTQNGLQESDDAGKTWDTFFEFRNQPVSLLKMIRNQLFVGAGNKLYRSNDLTRFQETFHLSVSSDLEPLDLEPLVEEAPSIASSSLFVTLAAPQETQPLWLGTAQGIYESADQGALWKKVVWAGAPASEILSLAYFESGKILFAASTTQVTACSIAQKKCREIYQGAAGQKFVALAIQDQTPPKLLALTHSGLVEYLIPSQEILFPASEISVRDWREKYPLLIASEPTAQELQRAVLRYNDVENGKIKRWQAGSRFAALLPTLSFGKDMSQSTSLSTTSGRYFQGPDDYSKGWDADVSWDLGDFIFSSAQTSIDSRQKLMVELRQDLLAEANRIYFERRRLRLEALASENPNDSASLEREIRIEELGALLDGMTGGWFSKQIKK